MFKWMSVYNEWMSVYDEWMSVYDEWMSVFHEWMSVYDGDDDYDGIVVLGGAAGLRLVV